MASGDAVNRFLNPYQPPQSEWLRADQAAVRKVGVVSAWAGSFGSVDAAEWYFALAPGPERNRPPYDFIEAFDLLSFSLECLELNFTQDAPRPLRELLETASFSSSYIEPVLQRASSLAIGDVQGIALLFNYDYAASPIVLQGSERLRFLGSFLYQSDAPPVKRALTIDELAQATGFPPQAIAALNRALKHAQADAGRKHVSARQLCAALHEQISGPDELIQCGLRTSEDFGRLVYALVELGVMRTSPNDQPSDFDGVYAV